MDFELTDEQRMFKEAIRAVVKREVEPLVDEAEEKGEFPVELFPRLGKLGYLAVRHPRKYGALGLDKICECIYIEEVARASAGIAAGLMIQSGLGTSIILDHGTEEQRQKYIVPAIKGDKIAAFGLTEPNAGSDAAAVETKAIRDGDRYIINGSKMFITNGPICDFVLVAAYTDKSKGASAGVSVLVVDKGTPGFRVAKKLDKLGHRSAATGELAFEDCSVPADNLVGEEGKGFPYLMGALAGGRISHSARSIGIAQVALEASIQYANERMQFGQPIGKFQAISFKLARMAMEIEAARWLMCRAAWLYDQGRDCRNEAAMTKLFASEVGVNVTSEAMHIHGGYGYMMEYPIQRYFRDAKLSPITEGTTEMQEIVISRGIGLPR